MSRHRGLTEDEVITHGGWHPRYARVLVTASDGNYGLVVVDGNGDGSELEAETWEWDGETWTGASSSGAGPLSSMEPVRARGQIGNAYFAYGNAPGRQTITISFDGHRYQIPVTHHGLWAFIKTSTSPGNPGFPTPMA